MVVDDQPGVRFLLSEALQKLGFIITLATEGNEALNKIAKEKPELVILDMKMPGMGGIEFLKQLRQRSITIPVLIITAYSEMNLIKQAGEYGVNYILNKPFDLEQLYQKVQTIFSEPKMANT
ncbi:MAG: two-component system, response regulator, stage 0 sporulation protein [Clostridia bacterium]|nr:two-component system, response regulator, stage 0 sporulation protein [Clostridia bacterium]